MHAFTDLRLQRLQREFLERLLAENLNQTKQSATFPAGPCFLQLIAASQFLQSYETQSQWSPSALIYSSLFAPPSTDEPSSQMSSLSHKDSGSRKWAGTMAEDCIVLSIPALQTEEEFNFVCCNFTKVIKSLGKSLKQNKQSLQWKLEAPCQ